MRRADRPQRIPAGLAPPPRPPSVPDPPEPRRPSPVHLELELPLIGLSRAPRGQLRDGGGAARAAGVRHPGRRDRLHAGTRRRRVPQSMPAATDHSWFRRALTPADQLVSLHGGAARRGQRQRRAHRHLDAAAARPCGHARWRPIRPSTWPRPAPGLNRTARARRSTYRRSRAPVRKITVTFSLNTIKAAGATGRRGRRPVARGLRADRVLPGAGIVVHGPRGRHSRAQRPSPDRLALLGARAVDGRGRDRARREAVPHRQPRQRRLADLRRRQRRPVRRRRRRAVLAHRGLLAHRSAAP